MCGYGPRSCSRRAGSCWRCSSSLKQPLTPFANSRTPARVVTARTQTPALLPVVKQLAGGQPIIVLSSNPAMGWPLARDADTKWASRYMSLWPLPALYHRELWTRPFRIVRARDAKVTSDFEREFRDEVIQDLQRWRPRLIVIPIPDSTVAGWGGAFRFDYLEYFNTDPRFRELMLEFAPAERVGPYQLWIRREGLSNRGGHPLQFAPGRFRAGGNISASY